MVRSLVVRSGVVGLVLMFALAGQAAAQLEKSISGNDLKLPQALPQSVRKKLLDDFDKRCSKGPSYAKVCCFTIAIDACMDPVLGAGCDPKQLVGYRICVEEACEVSCPIPEAREVFEQFQAKPH